MIDDNFQELHDFHRLTKIGKDFDRRDRLNAEQDKRNNRKLREPLEIGEKVLVQAERLKKKDAPGFLYKSAK